MKSIRQEVSNLINRGIDSHLRLAVTGLSRAGKTAFITSLVNQLLYSSTQQNLPLLSAARDKRLIGGRRVPQTNLLVPRFAYDQAIDALHANPPYWPEPTRDVSEIRLAIRYRPVKRARRLLGDSATLYLDIIDYPGEWLLDLPLLDMSYEQWSASQLDGLTGRRAELAKPWLAELAQFDPKADADETQLQEIAQSYTDYLYRCKQAGLHWVQPGRFVLPGELDGAPVLQFFPCVMLEGKGSVEAGKHSAYQMLKSRYQEYQNKVVKAFYRNHFSTFDRQIVLVDCLQPLNSGHESFNDMQTALDQIMKSFRYGRNSLLRRLFAPRIDKVLFAATKADHITPDQQSNMKALLQQMIHPAWQHTAFENIEMSCITMTSVQATTSGFVAAEEGNIPAIQGTTLDGQPMTLFPGEVPARLPAQAYWHKNQFEFTSFRPLPMADDQPCPHLRMDKALQYLIGDKLK